MQNRRILKKKQKWEFKVRKSVCWILGIWLLLLTGCGGAARNLLPGTTEPPDPHAGCVAVDDGRGGTMWVKEYEDVPVNAVTAADFSDGAYVGENYDVLHGIDVSEHQQSIDWAAAAADGVEFAVIRAGYRGYGQSGSLQEDSFFAENMKGARENGIPVGVYFFSQAVNADEAREEAEFLRGLLAPFGSEALQLPVFFDWEYIDDPDARTANVDGATLTDCALSFCSTLTAAGYTPGIYAYRYLGYEKYDLSRIAEYPLWIGAVNTYPDFYYAHRFWQYSTEGQVAGIHTDVDLDLWFLPRLRAEAEQN